MTEVESEILTLEELGACLKAGKRTVHRLAQKGAIPAFKLRYLALSPLGAGSPKASTGRSRRQGRHAPNWQALAIRERTGGGLPTCQFR